MKKTKIQPKSKQIIKIVISAIIFLIVLAGIIIINSNKKKQETIITAVNSYKTKVNDIQEMIQNEIKINSNSDEKYIATERSNFEELAKKVEVALNSSQLNTDEISSNGYTVSSYLTEEGTNEKNGEGYIVIWYSSDELRNNADVNKIENDNNLLITEENINSKEIALVSVIKIENKNSIISNSEITSITSGNSDIKEKESTFADSTLIKQLNFTGSVPEVNTEEAKSVPKMRSTSINLAATGGTITRDTNLKTGGSSFIGTGDITISSKALKKVSSLKSAGTTMTDKTEAIDDYKNKIVIPKGFKIASDSGTKITQGIVIEDVSAGTSVTKGSQFVWIPNGTVYTNTSGTTTETITLGRYEDFSAMTPKQPASKTDYTEPISIGSAYFEFDNSNSGTYNNTRAKNLGEFITSALDNGGFYIARYEAGINGTTATDSNTTQNGLQKDSATSGYIVSKKGVGVWNRISQANAAQVCANMYSANVESDLINGYAWDTAIVYIQKLGGSSNYYEANGESNADDLVATGNNKLATTNSADQQLKIYDMAANVREWDTETCITQDTHESNPVGRGGENGASWYVNTSSRYANGFSAVVNFGFRPILYLPV